MSRARAASASAARPAAASAARDPDDLYASDELTSSFAFSSAHPERKQPGPATFAVREGYTRPRAPRATIGKEERFSSTFAGMFVRAEAASELQCRDSPGPIYSPGFSTLPRSQTVSWGAKPGRGESSNRFHDPHLYGLSAGPAAYSVKKERVLRVAPRAVFGQSDRFNSFGGHAHAINNSPDVTDNGPVVSVAYVRPRSASYSFGGGKQRPPKGHTDETLRPRPRTAFLTHSIRGGLARPATLTAGIGPADYPLAHGINDIARKMKPQTKNGLGSAERFGPSRVESSGPGPNGSSQHTIAYQQRPALTSLHWCP